MKPKSLHQLPENIKQFLKDHPDIIAIIIQFMDRNSELKSIIDHIIQSYMLIVKCFDDGGKLFVCGNGGSFADSLHISGEMMKSFQRNRKLSVKDREKFIALPEGKILADSLEYGLPVLVLGLNHSLQSAIENDIPVPAIGFAQELFALGSKNDVLLGISTSGNAKNVIHAVTTARAIGMKTIVLTGQMGGKLAGIADIAIAVPGTTTHRIQEFHLHVYHTLCAIVEAHYFKAVK